MAALGDCVSIEAPPVIKVELIKQPYARVCLLTFNSSEHLGYGRGWGREGGAPFAFWLFT